MFRRLPNSLPPDPVCPTTLTELGYFVNKDDQIRMIDQPDQRYRFKINRSDRVNEVHLAAMNDCIRKIVHQRLTNLGLNTLRLPIGSAQTDPHVPVYVSTDLELQNRVLVVFGSRSVDAGIFSFRAIGDEGIGVGSAVSMVNAMFSSSTRSAGKTKFGLVLANPCQLIWYRGGGRAVGDKQWLSLPRASAVHEPFRIDPVDNRISGNQTYTEHVEYIFEHVMNGKTKSGTTFDIIGMEYTGMAVMHYLAANWNTWNHKINGICLGNPQHTVEELETISGTNKEFLHFVKKRVRGYMVSDEKVETPVAGIERTGCNCYASGEEYYEDGILVRGWRSMLDWFNMIASVDEYEEPTFTVVRDDDHGVDEVQGAVAKDNQA